MIRIEKINKSKANTSLTVRFPEDIYNEYKKLPGEIVTVPDGFNQKINWSIQRNILFPQKFVCAWIFVLLDLQKGRIPGSFPVSHKLSVHLWGHPVSLWLVHKLKGGNIETKLCFVTVFLFSNPFFCTFSRHFSLPRIIFIPFNYRVSCYSCHDTVPSNDYNICWKE